MELNLPNQCRKLCWGIGQDFVMYSDFLSWLFVQNLEVLSILVSDAFFQVLVSNFLVTMSAIQRLLDGQWYRRWRGQMGSMGLEAMLVGYVSQGDGVAVLVMVRDGTLLHQGLVVLVALVLDVARFFCVNSVSCFVTRTDETCWNFCW